MHVLARLLGFDGLPPLAALSSAASSGAAPAVGADVLEAAFEPSSASAKKGASWAADGASLRRALALPLSARGSMVRALARFLLFLLPTPHINTRRASCDLSVSCKTFIFPF